MRTHRILFSAVALCLAVAAPAQAGTRADLSGDAVVDFATTMDMPLMTVGNPGNAGESGYGDVDYVYGIAKFEVTAGQYVEFLNAVARDDPYGLYSSDMWDNTRGCKIWRSGPAGSYTYGIAADRADRPVNYVSWGDAARFANWLTNGMPTGAQDLTTTEDGSYALYGVTGNEDLAGIDRTDEARYVIPSVDEWYKAAYYAPERQDYYGYPVSSNSEPSNHLVDPDPGYSANFWDYGDGYTVGSPYWTTEAGEFENSASPYGTFDQGGNVWEWTEGLYTYASELHRRVYGGSFAGDGSWLSAYSFYLGGTHQNTIGFRVAYVPEPATLSLLALGACLPLFRRKRRQGLAALRRRR